MKFPLLTTLAVSAIPTLATPFAKPNDITISITLADNPVPAACTANGETCVYPSDCCTYTCYWFGKTEGYKCMNREDLQRPPYYPPGPPGGGGGGGGGGLEFARERVVTAGSKSAGEPQGQVAFKVKWDHGPACVKPGEDCVTDADCCNKSCFSSGEEGDVGWCYYE